MKEVSEKAISDYQKELDVRKKESEALVKKADQAQAFYDFYVRNRSVIACQANTALLRNFLGDDITSQSLQDAYEHCSVGNQLAHIAPDRVREKFLEEDKQEREDLISWIMANRTWASQESKESEFARLSRIESNIPIVSTETLRTIKANIENKRRLDKLSLPELKKEAREDEVKLLARHGIRESQWLPVPPLYQHKSMLYDLANRDLDGFKSLVKKCGKHQIDAILQQPEKD